MSSHQAFVSITLGKETYIVGRLWHHMRKGRESTSFEYDSSWLQNPDRFALEPTLKLIQTTFHSTSDQIMFGVFGDTAPDRWGRVLMRRAHNQEVSKKKEQQQHLSELDYLLRVNDEARQGALRFSTNPEGPFLNNTTKNSIPPLVELPQLLSATEHFIEHNETAEDLRLLLAPGSSLGGARPKASVRDRDGSLVIAKFPRKDDDTNIVLWEAVSLELAQKAGIQVPSWRIETITKKPVLITKRFDRTSHGRIPFLSAMSMLDARDNQQHSYIELAYALIKNGAHPAEDMSELWRRIVFNILISNTDDHMRNHGFLYERKKGWCLSPSYDMNPTPTDVRPRILTTMINLENATASLDLALSVIDDFRISKNEARKIIREVVASTATWKKTAQKLGLKKNDITRMASAFEHEDATQASLI